MLRSRRGRRVAAQPIEPVGAQQDEMNQQRQHEQECEQRDQSSARIEKKPNSPHFLVSYAKHEFTQSHGRHCHTRKWATIAITVKMMKLVTKIP